MPYTTPVSGQTITATWAIQNVRDQVVTPFASAAARTSQVTAPVKGMVSFLNDVNSLELYNGTQHVPLLPQSATVATLQSTSSTAYGDLTTVGPTVTTITGTSALVIVGCGANNTLGNGITYMGVAVSGASTIAANDVQAWEEVGTNTLQNSYVYLLTGLTAGSNTFTAKYRVSAGSGNIQNRSLTIIPLP